MPEKIAEPVEVVVRRSPRYSVFIGLGAALGVLVGLFFALRPPAEPVAGTEYARGSAVWLIVVLLAVGFGFLGAIVALVLDRVATKRARSYTVSGEYTGYDVVNPEALGGEAATAEAPAEDEMSSLEEPPSASGPATDPGDVERAAGPEGPEKDS